MAFSPAQVEQLLRPVNPRRVQRDNHGMSHLAAYDVSAHLTRIFGFGGWRKEILALELLAEDAVSDPKRDGRLGWWITYRCTMRLHVGDWWNDDGATGSADNLPDRGDAHDFALKNAISYALKRCAKDLGDQFGLSLYNKGSTSALVGRTLVGAEPSATEPIGPTAVEQAIPADLAPDWDEAPPGRADGLPVNRDGSLSRSRTTDEQKDAAGNMTDAQWSAHTDLQREGCPFCDGAPADLKKHLGTKHRGRTITVMAGVDAPWLDQPAGHLDGTEDKPGTIDPRDQRALHRFYAQIDRDLRLTKISALIGRTVTSSNDLSWNEGKQALAKLRAEGATV